MCHTVKGKKMPQTPMSIATVVFFFFRRGELFLKRCFVQISDYHVAVLLSRGALEIRAQYLSTSLESMWQGVKQNDTVRYLY
mmetsp:Transcript_54124/g.80663  ORF Transcript_54124/g.80663 Transcript_54124/m.80663 type:complete len:82 (+) Transcript_54124:276-521(+)